MMPIWLPLWQLIEFSNGLAILFIVVCLFTMIAFILRFVLAAVMFAQAIHMIDSRTEDIDQIFSFADSNLVRWMAREVAFA